VENDGGGEIILAKRVVQVEKFARRERFIELCFQMQLPFLYICIF
jgi:hypothetical protein